MRRVPRGFNPFVNRGRRTLVAILVVFAAVWSTSVVISISATARSRHHATIIQVASRQRMLADRYVQQILLLREGREANPAKTIQLMQASGRALLDGGVVPSVDGDDDETRVPKQTEHYVRGQLEQELHLIHDLGAAGNIVLGVGPATSKPTAHEHLRVTDPIWRVRVLAALTSNV
jgi:hypothetical protein